MLPDDAGCSGHVCGNLPAPVRICIVYDCLFPYTVGGAERWYRSLAERLVGDGHEVTYLTRRQWKRGTAVDIDPRVRVVALEPRLALYTASGRRRIGPPLLFGIGVLWHLARHGRRYDVVHMDSFPYFSLLAAGAARRRGRYRIVVDWFEVWSRHYWRGYLGRLGGPIGYGVQRACARVQQRAFCFSRLHEHRLRGEGLRGPVTILRGLYTGSRQASRPQGADDCVVFAGRLIPEKRAVLGLAAVAAAREAIPQLRATFYGDGPERTRLLAAIAERGLQETVTAPGFAADAVVESALAHATCLLLPSSREGYGLVVVEAAARGTPSVVVAGEDNAATELIEDGVNGFIARSAAPADVAAAIVRVHEAGMAMRERTARWFEEHADELSLEASLAEVLAVYRSRAATAPAPSAPATK